MIKALKNKYALSDQGAKDLLKGIIYSVLANISLMFPVILLAIVLNQLLAPVLGTSAPEISAAVYTVIGIVILAVVFIFHYCQYTAAYLGTYDESARRRIGLAEKLRTLPLTFFHQRDLADLTSTIMGIKKLPKVKELQTEYAKLLEEKKKIYAEYRRSREEMRELLTAKANVDRLLKMDEEQKQEKEKDHDQR